MADVFSKEKRSAIMRQVRSDKNKSTELKLIKYFRHRSIKGWRRRYKLFGKPDFVFPKLKVAIFVDGCFWHGHKCRNTTPKNNEAYWTAKISRNIERDKEVSEHLSKKDWKVIRIWECELKDASSMETKIDRLLSLI